MLAYFTLTGLEPDHAEAVAATALEAAGTPLPPFLGNMESARDWATWATLEERKAYALACFEALPAREQSAFLHHISKREVAA